MRTNPYKEFLPILKYMERTGTLPGTDNAGLCDVVYDMYVEGNNTANEIIDLFEPTLHDEDVLDREEKSSRYWGSDSYSEERSIATDLRKTIIAFCAAINDEL